MNMQCYAMMLPVDTNRRGWEWQYHCYNMLVVAAAAAAEQIYHTIYYKWLYAYTYFELVTLRARVSHSMVSGIWFAENVSFQCKECVYSRATFRKCLHFCELIFQRAVSHFFLFAPSPNHLSMFCVCKKLPTLLTTRGAENESSNNNNNNQKNGLNAQSRRGCEWRV